MTACLAWRSNGPAKVGSPLLVRLMLASLGVLAPVLAAAQQPPLESALTVQPLEPREQLMQPDFEGAEAVLFAGHRGLALALAPVVDFGVEKKLLGGGSGSIGGLKIAPGSLGSGSGVGLTVGYVFYSEPFWGGASAGASLRGYMDHSAFLGVRDRRGGNYLRGTFGYDLDTQDGFSGLTMASPEDFETDYRQEEVRFLGDGQISPGELIHVGLRGGYRRNTILEGKNDDLLDIKDVFGDSLLAGVGILPGISGEEGKYGQGGAFLAFDTRNDARNPDRGVLLAASFDAFRGLSDTPFDWNRFGGEFAGYLPLPNETRLVAVRLFAVHQEPLHGQSLVPFYYLSSLGGSTLLRSFSSFRFQDNDLVYGAAEFRRRVWAHEAGQAALDASLFVESAGAYRDITDEVELGDMEQSYGTELRLLVPNDVIARFGAALGNEGGKIYVGGGGRF